MGSARAAPPPDGCSAVRGDIDPIRPPEVFPEHKTRGAGFGSSWAARSANQCQAAGDRLWIGSVIAMQTACCHSRALSTTRGVLSPVGTCPNSPPSPDWIDAVEKVTAEKL